LPYRTRRIGDIDDLVPRPVTHNPVVDRRREGQIRIAEANMIPVAQRRRLQLSQLVQERKHRAVARDAAHPDSAFMELVNLRLARTLRSS